ncbi:hypothetical protein TNCV_3005501 [Trichonephila clavipes]|nr:hypothetical protein TNCV_3005501 [Trichonephila clavipes]
MKRNNDDEIRPNWEIPKGSVRECTQNAGDMWKSLLRLVRDLNPIENVWDALGGKAAGVETSLRDKQEHPHPCTHRGMYKLASTAADNVVQKFSPPLRNTHALRECSTVSGVSSWLSKAIGPVQLPNPAQLSNVCGIIHFVFLRARDFRFGRHGPVSFLVDSSSLPGSQHDLEPNVRSQSSHMK